MMSNILNVILRWVRANNLYVLNLSELMVDIILLESSMGLALDDV